MFGLGAIPGALLCAMYFVMPLTPSDIEATFQKSVQKYAEKDKPTGAKMYVEILKTQKKGILLSAVLAATLQFTGMFITLVLISQTHSNG